MKFSACIVCASLVTSAYSRLDRSSAGSVDHYSKGLKTRLEDASKVVVSNALIERALPNSPDGYTPSHVQCPSSAPSVRPANSLSPNETAWLQLRRNATIQPMRDFLTRMNISGFDAGSYIDQYSGNTSALPNIGIAFSGGGWRALSNGAGVLKAMDSRSTDSTAKGHIGGLLQSATYLAGLSGGNWLVGSIYQNNFTTVEDLVNNGHVWQFGNSVLQAPPSSGISILNDAEYYSQLESSVNGKQDAGFEISITDYWGRGLSYQLIDADEGGPAYTWSSIAQTPGFQNASQPFPIVLADERNPGQIVISANSSVFEFNPFEMGTWDASTYGFVPTQYLGTNFTNGVVNDASECVVGFDNAGFVMGTSSSIFNSAIVTLANTDTSSIPSVLLTLLTNLVDRIGASNEDIAQYSPNPFYRYNPTSANPNADSTDLSLVDGGEDNQNIPFYPLIQPVRHVDVIFANDNSADTSTNWPNGSSLVTTYERALAPISNGTGFPSVPDVNTFINLGLNTRPTFFGCNSSNITIPGGSRAGYTGADVPLVVYLPNYPYNTFSNESTVSLTTNNTYRDAMILNGYNVATMGNGTTTVSGVSGDDWMQCVGCAVLARSFERTGTKVPSACSSCFETFCWNGTVDAREPGSYEPSPVLNEKKSSHVSSSAGVKRMYGLSASVLVGLVSCVTAVLT